MRCRGWVVAVALGLGLAPGVLVGQEIESGVARVDDGTVRLAYATRPGVEICDEGIRMGGRQIWWRSDHGARGPSNCRVGSVEVELEIRDGWVRSVEVVRAADRRSQDAVDLGEVGAREAADYFLALARESTGRDVAGEAILPAVLADVDEVWRELLSMARDTEVRRDVRKNALFWVGQEAADAATQGLAAVARDEDEDQEVRNAAVFALSQRPDEQGIPILMEVARTARDPETRRMAMFWLAQSEDGRVLAFFEEILLGEVGG